LTALPVINSEMRIFEISTTAPPAGLHAETVQAVRATATKAFP